MNLRSKRDDDLDINVNLVSFIDVLLCLVIFFMVSTTFVRKSEIALTLPQASKQSEKTVETDKLEISIDPVGSCNINGKALVNARWDTIKEGLAEAAKTMKDPTVLIKADAKATHQSVIAVLDAARQLGLLRVTFATEDRGDTPGKR